MDKCPFCEAGLDIEEPETHYSCGSPRQYKLDVYRAGKCYEREISNLKKQLKAFSQANKDLGADFNRVLRELVELKKQLDKRNSNPQWDH